MSTLKNRNGFTLMEIMMVVALLGIFSAIVYGFLNFNFRFANQSAGEHASYIQARAAMIRLVYTLQKHQTLYLDTAGEKIDRVDQNGARHGLVSYKKNPTRLAAPGFDYYFLSTRGDIGQLLNRNGDVVSDNITFTASNPYGNVNLIRIAIEAYPQDQPDAAALKLYTVVNSNREVRE